LCIGPLVGRRERERVSLCFPYAAWPIEDAYLLCRYSLQDKCCAMTRPEREKDYHPGFVLHQNHSRDRAGARQQEHFSLA
jgi:hypothetical protein